MRCHVWKIIIFSTSSYAVLPSTTSFSSSQLQNSVHRGSAGQTTMSTRHAVPIAALLALPKLPATSLCLSRGNRNVKQRWVRAQERGVSCWQGRTLLSLPHFYFLQSWSTKWSGKGCSGSTQRLCATSDGSGWWVIYWRCANYLLPITADSCSKP